MASEAGEAVRAISAPPKSNRIGWTLLALAAISCGPPRRLPVLVTERRECIVEAPPKAPEGILIEACPGGDDGDFAACLSKPSAIALIGYLTALQRYARDAHAKCGPMPEE